MRAFIGQGERLTRVGEAPRHGAIMLDSDSALRTRRAMTASLGPNAAARMREVR